MDAAEVEGRAFQVDHTVLADSNPLEVLAAALGMNLYSS